MILTNYVFVWFFPSKCYDLGFGKWTDNFEIFKEFLVENYILFIKIK